MQLGQTHESKPRKKSAPETALETVLQSIQEGIAVIREGVGSIQELLETIVTLLQMIQEHIVDLKIVLYVVAELILVYCSGLSPDAAHEVVSELFTVEDEPD